MNPDLYLPEDILPSQVAVRIGLISDTHMPEHSAEFRPALFDVLEGVDLLLHAGDVGELWVLDRLSEIAPVVAVHGNDETKDAETALPYSQVVTVAGQRILHYEKNPQTNPLLELIALGESTEPTDVADGGDEVMMREGVQPVSGWSASDDSTP